MRTLLHGATEGGEEIISSRAKNPLAAPSLSGYIEGEGASEEKKNLDQQPQSRKPKARKKKPVSKKRRKSRGKCHQNGQSKRSGDTKMEPSY